MLHQALRYGASYGAPYVLITDYNKAIVVESIDTPAPVKTHRNVVQVLTESISKRKLKWYQANTVVEIKLLIAYLTYIEGRKIVESFQEGFINDLVQHRLRSK